MAQLEKAGITVYVSEAETIEAVWQEMRDLAKIFSVENIEEIVSEQSTRLEAVADKLGNVTEPKTVFVLDSFIGEKLYTAGSANIESAYITAAGGAKRLRRDIKGVGRGRAVGRSRGRSLVHHHPRLRGIKL